MKTTSNTKKQTNLRQRLFGKSLRFELKAVSFSETDSAYVKKKQQGEKLLPPNQ